LKVSVNQKQSFLMAVMFLIDQNEMRNFVKNLSHIIFPKHWFKRLNYFEADLNTNRLQMDIMWWQKLTWPKVNSWERKFSNILGTLKLQLDYFFFVYIPWILVCDLNYEPVFFFFIIKQYLNAKHNPWSCTFVTCHILIIFIWIYNKLSVILSLWSEVNK